MLKLKKKIRWTVQIKTNFFMALTIVKLFLAYYLFAFIQKENFIVTKTVCLSLILHIKNILQCWTDALKIFLGEDGDIFQNLK